MFKNYLTLLFTIACTPLLAGYVLSPELSIGVHDNGPGWFEVVPYRVNFENCDGSKMSGAFSYAFEVARNAKAVPFRGLNHHGWRFLGTFEKPLTRDMSMFFEVNVGSTVPGAVETIPYFQTGGYQRFGIKWNIAK